MSTEALVRLVSSETRSRLRPHFIPRAEQWAQDCSEPGQHQPFVSPPPFLRANVQMPSPIDAFLWR